MFSACLIPKQNFWFLYKSKVLTNTLYCEVIHKQINFQIINYPGCATNSPLKRGPMDLLGAGVWPIQRDKEFHRKPNFEPKYLISLLKLRYCSVLKTKLCISPLIWTITQFSSTFMFGVVNHVLHKTFFLRHPVHYLCFEEHLCGILFNSGHAKTPLNLICVICIDNIDYE